MAEDYPENLILAAELLKFAKNKLVSLELDENGNNLTVTLPIPERFVKIVKNAQQVLNGQPVEAHSGGTNEYEWTLRLVSGLGGKPDLVKDAGAQITCKFCHEVIDGGEENYLEHLDGHTDSLKKNIFHGAKALGEGKYATCIVCSTVCTGIPELHLHTEKCKKIISDEFEEVEKRQLTCKKCNQFFKQKIRLKKHKCPVKEEESKPNAFDKENIAETSNIQPIIEANLNPLSIQTCEICNTSENFTDMKTFMMHVANHFLEFWEKHYLVSSAVYGACSRKSCKASIKNLQEYIEHTAVYHEKLFKCLVAQNRHSMAKALFPHKTEGSITSTETGSKPSHRGSVEDTPVKKGSTPQDLTVKTPETLPASEVPLRVETPPVSAPSVATPPATSISAASTPVTSAPAASTPATSTTTVTAPAAKPNQNANSTKTIGQEQIKLPILGKRGLICPICRQMVKDSLNIHLSTGHFQDEILKLHPPTKNSEGRLHCPICYSDYANKYAMARHIGRVHGVMDRLFKEKGLVIEEEPNPLHSVQQQRSGGIICDGCRMEFASKENLRLHTCHSLLDKMDRTVSNERSAKVESTSNAKKRALDDDKLFAEMDRIHGEEEPEGGQGIPVDLAGGNDSDNRSEEPLEKKSKIELTEASDDSSDDDTESDSDSEPRDLMKLCKGCNQRYPVKTFAEHIKSSKSECSKFMFR